MGRLCGDLKSCFIKQRDDKGIGPWRATTFGVPRKGSEALSPIAQSLRRQRIAQAACIVGVRSDLDMARKNCARPHAPETQIEKALDTLDDTFRAQFGVSLLREHESIAALLRRTHRFRAVEPDGLLVLAKELNRLLMERIDMDALRGPAAIAPKDRLGTLKALERLLEQSLGQAGARVMMAPLFGINDLRNADAHLGSSLVESGLERVLSVGCELVSTWRSPAFKRMASDGKVLPLSKSGRAAFLVCLTIDEVALRIEMVVQAGVDGSKFL
jgi:hypothetical protein